MFISINNRNCSNNKINLDSKIYNSALKLFFTCQKVVRLAEKVKRGEKVRNICQKVVQLAEKGEKRGKS